MKTVLSIRNYLDLQYKGKKLLLWQHIYKRFFSRADRIVSVSQEISELMVNKYHLKADKCVTIYNPYDLDAIHSACTEKVSDVHLNQMKDTKVIATLGHLGKQKAMERLVRIMPDLIKEVPNALLLIIGSTENTKYFHMLKDLAKTNKVADHILFVGSQQNPFKYLHCADAYCLSSQFEGFPNALVEAMACGLPVVATNCHSGPKEIISEAPLSDLYQETDYGILVDGEEDAVPSDGLSVIEGNIKKGLVKLLTDDVLNEKYRRQSLKRVEDFSVHIIVDEWQQLIASLLV
jgi:glycosyltransferase involved in cell wall biosynthesis